jgi:hypothetical protein
MIQYLFRRLAVAAPERQTHTKSAPGYRPRFGLIVICYVLLLVGRVSRAGVPAFESARERLKEIGHGQWS